ncbi:class A beta-lactamase-related serine hydrolase [Lentilactobacillus hilgardii]|nr:serine hydrolase [Lentilactobacillus hilgardii]MCV3739924.1 class A beta-lactamase-related serine hydrolase [Lentilactobacillus hilgardii]
MKHQITIFLLVLLIGLTLPSSPVYASTPLAHQQAAITKMTKRDMAPGCGKWSVKITRLNRYPLSVKVGNHPVTKQRSASTIKVFIMLTVFHEIKQHHLKLTQTIKHDLKQMIGISDNAAANRLIRKVGGFKRVTNTARHFGFTHTVLKRFMLGSLKHGDNKTSVDDLTGFLTKTYRHQLLGKHDDNQMLTLLRHCQNHSKLPKLIKHAKIYNKTGEYPMKGVQNDAALIKTKKGVYTIVVMAQGGKQVSQYRSMNRLGRDVVAYLDRH